MSRRDPLGMYVLEGRAPRRARSTIEWGRWMQDADRRVARTLLLDGSEVSTVFLGLDHQWDNGPPLLFETCIFFSHDTVPPRPSPFTSGRLLGESEVQARYATWAEAELGHIEICEKLAHALPEWKPKPITEGDAP